ncbi:MAG: ARMT1-like domain-containing protein [Eubacteriales bacterium]
MEIFLDCLPCTLRQVLEASRMVTNDTKLQEKIMEESLKVLSNYKNFKCSPDMGRAMHNIVKKYTGVLDPYRKIKLRDMEEAKKVYPMLKRFLKEKDGSNYWALKVAATGNIIDSAIINIKDIESVVEEELERKFVVCDIDIFEEKLKTAKSLLILGDNAGETVFDKVFIENLPDINITYAVRSEPVLNDTTEKEAYDSGLGECTKIISTGCSAPGLILKECSNEFLNIFNTADIVISKGQGNFEALSDYNRKVFFLLKAKCPKISSMLDVDLYEYVFKNK